MPTRNVVLTEQQAAFLDGLVESGRYQDVDEAIRDGVRRLEGLEEDRRVVAAHFDQLLRESEDRTGSRPAEDVFNDLRAALHAKTKAAE
ncbi:MAG: type II toxin-antitoxin system ParD family antitoxin [Shimia sp.]